MLSVGKENLPPKKARQSEHLGLNPYDDNHTIFDTFVEWLIQLPTHYPEDDPTDDDRPLPFPQDRRGNKARIEVIHRIPLIGK